MSSIDEISNAKWDDLIKYNCKVLEYVIPRKQEITDNYENDKINGKCDENLKIIRLQLTINKYLILINKYPYYLDDNISHYVFWFRGEYTMEEVMEISKQYFKTDKIIVTTNAQHLKSVPDINHHHIFVYNII
jgi:hypothetical protein